MRILSTRFCRPILVLVAWFSVGAFANASTGDAVRGREVSKTCVSCHEVDGNSTNAAFPKLAGQNAPYLLRQMRAIRDGRVKVVVMGGMLDGMEEQDLQDIAAWYTSQTMSLGVARASLVERGEAIYRGGIVERGVPACIACHSPTGTGNYAAGYPRVSGQHASYLLSRLLGYRDGVGAYDDMSSIMHDVASFMSKQDMEAVAEYMAGLR